MKGVCSLILCAFFSYVCFSQSCDSVAVEFLTDPGPYEVALIKEVDGLRNGPDYNGATVYYPTNGKPPYPSIAIVPGFLSAETTIKDWGPYYASHGIVAITIGTNQLTDQPDVRGKALLDALETLKQENIRQGSPLKNSIDVDRFAVSGWSMGGGGAQLAAVSDPNIKAVVALCPWLGSSTNLKHEVPVLILSGEDDAVAPPASHADLHYENTPGSTVKLLYEVKEGDHRIANTPQGANGDMGRVALSWLKLHLIDDNCYCPLLNNELLDNPASSSKILTNLTCSPLVINELKSDKVYISNIYPNPTSTCVSIEGEFIKPMHFELVSVLGKPVIHGVINSNNYQIDLSGLAPNIYFLKVKNQTLKIIKNN